MKRLTHNYIDKDGRGIVGLANDLPDSMVNLVCFVMPFANTMRRKPQSTTIKEKFHTAFAAMCLDAATEHAIENL